MAKYTTKDMTCGSGNRIRYTFEEKNRKGETIIFDLSHCENHDGPNSLPKMWKRAGLIDRVLQSWIVVDIFVYDSAGKCRRKYEPTVDESGRHINFAWMIEDTPENRERMIAEIHRRAFEEVRA